MGERQGLLINKKHIRLSKSVLSVAEAEAVSRVLLEDGYLGMGREVQAFEEELAAFFGIPKDRVICVKVYRVSAAYGSS